MRSFLESLLTIRFCQGNDHHDVVEHLHHIAWTFDKIGAYKEALNVYQEILRIEWRSSHQGSFAVGKVLCMIGQVLWSEGDFCNALKTYKEALSLLNRFLGNHSRNKIYLLRVIGCICIENGDIKEANEAYLQSSILSHIVESEEISEYEDISEESNN